MPWSWPTLVATMLAVESSFYFAGALAPAVVYSANRAPDEIPLDDQLAFARDMQAVFDDPTTFADIVLCAEVTQTVLALLIIFLVANSRAPLPPGWFRFSLNPSGVDPTQEQWQGISAAMKAKGHMFETTKQEQMRQEHYFMTERAKRPFSSKPRQPFQAGGSYKPRWAGGAFEEHIGAMDLDGDGVITAAEMAEFEKTKHGH